MAIKIKSLEAPPVSKNALENGFLYKDLSLDLSPSYSYNSQLNRNEVLKDVQAIYDVESVKNSVVNALLTSPGEKILNPTYGVDLRQYLFEPIDDFTTDLIKDDIEIKLPLMEPRIVLKSVNVIADEDNNQYNIELQIDVPSLDVYGLSIKSELASTGYVIA
jgi:phage baseplate assembly protein W